MSSKQINNVCFTNTWTSFIASLGGALRSAGLWDGEAYQLMGKTGMAFHFIVHEKLCPSSVTVYQWHDEHICMLDRIGVHSSYISTAYSSSLNTIDLVRKDSIEAVKKSIDRGVPVIIWAPSPTLEFGLITGYDDKDKVFFIKACSELNEDDPLLYDNIGKSEVPILYTHFVHGKVDLDEDNIYRSSLEAAVHHWNLSHHIGPQYAAGKKAYSNFIGALKKGGFDPFGLIYITSVYANSKEHIASYLEEIVSKSQLFPGLGKSLQDYRRISDLFKQAASLVPFQGADNSNINEECIPQLISLLEEAESLENSAMDNIAKILQIAI